jgi:hypothetical protein
MWQKTAELKGLDAIGMPYFQVRKPINEAKFIARVLPALHLCVTSA